MLPVGTLVPWPLSHPCVFISCPQVLLFLPSQTTVLCGQFRGEKGSLRRILQQTRCICTQTLLSGLRSPLLPLICIFIQSILPKTKVCLLKHILSCAFVQPSFKGFRKKKCQTPLQVAVSQGTTAHTVTELAYNSFSLFLTLVPPHSINQSSSSFVVFTLSK